MHSFCSGKSVVLRSLSTFFLTAFSIATVQKFANAQAASTPGNPLLAQARTRIERYIDDDDRVTLTGNRHPLAIPQNDLGPVAPDYPMDRMILILLPDAAQEDALNQFLESQQDSESPYYHRWLTPEQYAESFGVSEDDARQVAEWLQGHGMDIEEIAGGRRAIVFSGTAAQVESAFHTQIHSYNIKGEIHHANSSDPQIPAALAGVVGGVLSLHDFRAQPMNTGARLPTPQFTSGRSYYLAPADFATIYDLHPAYQQAINGAGQSIAVVARSNINMSDVLQFRSSFDLPANIPQIVVNGTDPGIWSASEETEADLDVEWSGAIAKAAAIKFVVSKSTNSTDGVYLSAEYIVSHNLAPILTVSFGLCEPQLGISGNTFINHLWQQAAAEGITVFVSSGDSGAADCDSSSAAKAVDGRAVNGLCSTPYSVCVGGTEFNDTTHPSLYWSSANNAQAGSALTYIPEVSWNESGNGGLWSGGGGASSIYRKPYWQTGRGVPADGKRDVPDVSLSSAGHDGYLIYQNGALYVVGGTSAAAPSFADIMALLLQKEQSRVGVANPFFYTLAAKQAAGGASVFHDITSGNNGVPGQTGFNAGPGYDQATGLGSVDGSVLISHWNDATSTPTFRLSPSTGSVRVAPGSSVSLSLSVVPNGGFSGPVAFSISRLPSGISAKFSPTTIAGSASSTLRFSTKSNTKAGTYHLAVSATSGTVTQTVPVSIVCSR
jgi:pseudomonalisin